MNSNLNEKMPDANGYFGQFGGCYVNDDLKKAMNEIAQAYDFYSKDKSFNETLAKLSKTFTGRPSPVYYAKRLTEAIGGADIYLKREDLNHTGSHKLNHCLGEVLLAKKLGKKKVIAETGAGQHGGALATAAALFGLECDIYMGAIDVMKEAPNVSRMKILGAHVISVTQGTQSLKDAVDAAFEAYIKDTKNTIYCIGTVVGPAPFPGMVRDFQSIIGYEARQQFLDTTGKLPDDVVACVGGGSNAIGIFSAFLNDCNVNLYGVEPGGKGLESGQHAATLEKGSVGILHGSKTYILQDSNGSVLPVYTIASSLDYPGVGPQHSYLKDIKRVRYVNATDREAVESFYVLSRMEGIIPALESSHAVSYGVQLAKLEGKGKNILINLSGRGDKDIDFVMQHYPLSDYEKSDNPQTGYENFMNSIGDYR